MNEIQHFTPM